MTPKQTKPNAAVKKPYLPTLLKWADIDRRKHYEGQGVCYCDDCGKQRVEDQDGE